MKRFVYSLIGIIALMIILLFTGCKSIQYVPVEVVKTEYIVKTDSFIQRDSVHCIDSVWVEKKGDTVTVQKIKIIYKDKWREVIQTDTLIKTDSIQVPYPVEKKLTKWEKTKMDIGGFAIGGFFVLVIILIISWIVKVKGRV